MHKDEQVSREYCCICVCVHMCECEREDCTSTRDQHHGTAAMKLHTLHAFLFALQKGKNSVTA